MLAGHYTTAFVAKAVSPRTPLWLLLLAAQLVDVVWALFILTGVEQARLDPSLASNPLVLHHMPFTHSLAGSAGWAALAWFAVRRRPGLQVRDAGLVAAVVVSHWFLDFVVHRPDLTLAGGGRKLGLALWDFPLAALGLEIALVAASVALAIRACAGHERARRAWLLLGGGLVLLQLFTAFGPLPPTIAAVAATGLVTFLAVAAAGEAVDRAGRSPA